MSLFFYRVWLSVNRPVGSQPLLDWLSNLAALLITGLVFVQMAHWYALAYAAGAWDLKVILLAFWLFAKAAAGRVRIYNQQVAAAKAAKAAKAVVSAGGLLASSGGSDAAV